MTIPDDYGLASATEISTIHMQCHPAKIDMLKDTIFVQILVTSKKHNIYYSVNTLHCKKNRFRQGIFPLRLWGKSLSIMGTLEPVPSWESSLYRMGSKVLPH